MSNKRRVAAIAATVCLEHARGRRWVLVDGVTFDTVKSGYCTRFVRQVHEAALGLPPFSWEFAAPDARACEEKLRAAGKQTDTPQPGDIICMNRTRHRHGHIGIYLGKTVAHNTSSKRWGPGTVITPFNEVEHLVSGYYAVLPAERALKIVLLPDNRVLAEGELPPDGNYELIDHIHDQGKIYLRPR